MSRSAKIWGNIPHILLCSNDVIDRQFIKDLLHLSTKELEIFFRNLHLVFYEGFRNNYMHRVLLWNFILWIITNEKHITLANLNISTIKGKKIVIQQ